MIRIALDLDDTIFDFLGAYKENLRLLKMFGLYEKIRNFGKGYHY